MIPKPISRPLDQDPTRSPWSRVWIVLSLGVLLFASSWNTSARSPGKSTSQKQLLLQSLKNAIATRQHLKASEIVQNLLKRFPKSKKVGSAYYQYARFLERSKYKPQALKAYQDMLRRFPSHPYASSAGYALQRISGEYIYFYLRNAIKPNTPIQFSVSSRNINTLRFQLWKVDLLDYILKGHNPQRPSLNLFRKKKLTSEWSVNPTYRRYNWKRYWRRYRYANTKVKYKGLKAGIYMLVASGKFISSSTLLRVSDYGVIVKRSQSRLLAFVKHTRKAKVAVGASVYYLSNGKVLIKGKTNSDGVFVGRLPKKKPYSGFVLSKYKNEVLISNSYHWNRNRNQAISLFYTDRPTYRPGNKLHFKVITRERHFESQEVVYRFKPGQKVLLQIKNPRYSSFYQKTLTTNDFGTLNGTLSIPKAASLGRYTVRLKYKNRWFHSSFYVEAYKKPEYIVSVRPHKPSLLLGDKARFTISAKYYYGQPVKGAKVTYTVYRTFRPIYSIYRRPYYRRYRFKRRYYRPYRRTYRKQVMKNVGKLNAKGQLAIHFPTLEDSAKSPGTYSYTVAVEVVDASRRQIKASATVAAHTHSLRLKLQNDKYSYSPGDSVSTLVRTVSYTGKPVSKKVTLNILLRDKKSYKFKNVRTHQLQTTASGQASWLWKPRKEGYYQLQAQTKDSKGKTVKLSRYFWYISSTYRSMYRYSGLQMKSDKASYKPGETAGITITSGYGNTISLMTFEAEELMHYRVIRQNSSVKQIQQKVFKRFAPNVNMVLTTFAQGNLVRSYLKLKAPSDVNRLKVQAVSLSKSYKPGEEATFRIRVLDHKGKPVKTEIALGIVDKSIYAIRPDQSPSMFSRFFLQRIFNVSTHHSLYFWSRSLRGAALQKPASPMKAPSSRSRRQPKMKKKAMFASGVKDSEKAEIRSTSSSLAKARIRKSFADTALWSPTLRTDQDGYVTIQMTIPDNLTTWVLVARAISKDTRVGVHRVEFKTRKDFLVRLQTPRTMTEGDRVTISGIVHNDLKKDQKVTVDLITSNLRVLGSRKKVVLVKAGRKARVDFQVKALFTGISKLQVRARSKRHADAMERKVPVLPYGVRQTLSDSGIVRSEIQKSFLIPHTAKPRSIKMKVVLSPSLAGTMLDALQYLVGFPYGCVEQTMSRMLPNVYVAQILNQLNLKHPTLHKKLPKMVRKGVLRLLALQHYDGGWGWWKHDKTHPFMTAYALYGLTMAKKSGFDVLPSGISRGANRLRRLLKSTKNLNTVAFMAYSLSFHQAPPEVVLVRLIKNRAKLNNYGKALLSMTLRKSRWKKEAGQLVDELIKGVDIAAGLASWGGKSWKYRWRDNTIATTAYGLKALVQSNPRHPLVPKVIRYLLSQRQGNRWRSTKDTAAVIYAFSDYLKATGELNPNYRLEVLLNGKRIRSVQIQKSNMLSFKGTIELDHTQLKKGKNKVVIRKSGSGNLYYSVFLRYYNRAKSLPATSSGLIAKREYFRVIQDGAKRKLVPYRGEKLRSGQMLQVKLTIKAPANVQYLMVEDYLPAGCEVIKSTTPRAYSRYRYRYRYRRYSLPYNHKERRDEKMVFFKTTVSKGVHVFTYNLRAEIPGNYSALPTFAELMYHRSVTGTSKAQIVRIRD